MDRLGRLEVGTDGCLAHSAGSTRIRPARPAAILSAHPSASFSFSVVAIAFPVHAREELWPTQPATNGNGRTRA
jgi:hypothetical protein